MKKTIRMAGMLLMAIALCLGVTSCGDDDDMPVVLPKEQRTENGANGFCWKESSTDLYAPGYLELKEGEGIVLRCFPEGKNELVYLPTDAVQTDCDSKYISVSWDVKDPYGHGGAGYLAKLTIKALAPTNGTPTNLTIGFTVDGVTYKTILPVTVLSKDESSKDQARRIALKEYWQSQRGSQTPMDLAPINATKLPDYIETAKGLMMLETSNEDVLREINNFTPVDNTNIYPGSIVYINEGLADGKPEPVKFVGNDTQGTVTVNLTFLAGAGNKTSIHNVKNESGAILQAINLLMAQVFGSGGKITPPADISPDSSTSNSVEKLAYDLKVNASFLGAKCGMNLKESNTATKIYKMMYFNQSFYSIEVTPENGDDTNYLGKDVTLDAFKDAERAGGKIGIIKAVYYGRFGYLKKEYESKKMTLIANESASYKEYASASSSQDIDKFCETANVSGRVYGGSAREAGLALKNEASFMKTMLSSTEVSYSNQGVPIYYVVEYLGTSKPAIAKQTGRVSNITEYKPCPNYLYIEPRNHVNMVDGSRVFLDLFYDTFKMVNGKQVDVQKNVKKNVEMASKTTYRSEVQLPEGEYFKPKCRYQVTYNHSKGGSYSTAESGYFDISDGRLVVCIEGETRLGGDKPHLNYICGGQQNVDMPIGWVNPNK